MAPMERAIVGLGFGWDAANYVGTYSRGYSAAIRDVPACRGLCLMRTPASRSNARADGPRIMEAR